MCVFGAKFYHIWLADADPGGGERAMPPLSLLKLTIKKMAAIGGPLYFMFLAPPPSDHVGFDDAGWTPFIRVQTTNLCVQTQIQYFCKGWQTHIYL